MREQLEALIAQNKLPLADKLARDTLAEMDAEQKPLEYCGVLQAIARIAVLRGRLPEAIKQLRQSCEIKRRVLGPTSRDLGATLHSLGDLLTHSGLFEEAEQTFWQAIEAMEGELGPDHPDLVPSLTNLGSILARRGAMHQGEQLMCRALKNSQTSQDPAQTARLLAVLAQTRAMLNHPETAPTAKKALQMMKETLGEAHFEYQIVHDLLETLAARPDPPPDWGGQLGMGANLMKRGLDAHAIEVLKSVCQQARDAQKTEPEAWACGMLTTLYIRSNQPQLALESSQRALDLTQNLLTPEALEPFIEAHQQAQAAVQAASNPT